MQGKKEAEGDGDKNGKIKKIFTKIVGRGKPNTGMKNGNVVMG